MEKVIVFTGNAHPRLAEDICKYIGVPLSNGEVLRFSDGETRVKIQDNVRGKDVFIIQPTSCPANEHLMELLVMIDAIKRSSAKRITAVLPYFGYARQDRKDQPRVPITAKLVANLLDRAGADRVLTIDLHAGQIQGFFDIPLDNLYAVKIFGQYFGDKGIKNLVIVSPDVGGIKMARAYAKKLGAGLAIVDKRRISDTQAEAMHIMGEVEGKNVIIVDDIIATAGSISEAVGALRKNGAKDIYVAATHPVLSGPAIERLAKINVKELVFTDTIPISKEKMLPMMTQLSVAPLLGEAIKRIRKEESISELFE
ncbi:MAG: ribose-phosphate pyrophosphokinase [Candidatus Omnitrophica bacterium]|jgi:ribose-phosphate pyrophosphokinase|nr:ribose-phosphate pyrophosphokinase [Candidatus Omnitrophota bacterium]MDD4013479.1 ribose-phosphate pyrophosphokinase [Candidatus Omnitrophota bacterium]